MGASKPAKNPPIARRGFTLVEAAVSMAIASVLLVGMGGALSMSVTDLDHGDDANSRLTAASAAADQLLADAQSATAIDASVPGAVTFTVPDRNNDGSAESIRYAWTAGASGPLTRVRNNGPAHTLLPSIESIALVWLPGPSRASSEGAEQLLSSFDTVAGVSNSGVSIDSDTAVAEYLKPPFADNVVAWRIARIRVRLSRSGPTTGTVRVSLVAADSLTPSGSVIASVDIPESTLAAALTWVDLALATPNLAPSQGVFIRVQSVGASGTAAVTERGSASTGMPLNMFYLLSGNGGTSWSLPDTHKALRFFAYGTVTTTP